MIKYRINPTDTERALLPARVTKGKGKATDMVKANVLLASDEKVERRSETAISEAHHLCSKTVERIRRQFCEGAWTSLPHSPAKPGAISK